jgi:hypothetical protein
MPSRYGAEARGTWEGDALDRIDDEVSLAFLAGCDQLHVIHECTLLAADDGDPQTGARLFEIHLVALIRGCFTSISAGPQNGGLSISLMPRGCPCAAIVCTAVLV